MTAETERLYADVPDTISLPKAGFEVRVRRLRTKQFFLLMRIVTRGGLAILPEIDWDVDQEDFTQQMAMLLAFALPEAGPEAVEFLLAMVDPISPEVTLERADGSSLWADGFLDDEGYADPEIEDVVVILEQIVRQEADDLKALGNRLRSMLEVTRKTGQLKPDGSPPKTSTSTETPSSEALPPPST